MFLVKNMWQKFQKAENIELKDVNDIHNLNQKEIQVEVKRYETMLAELAKDPTRNSFYCLPADEKDIPGLSGEYLGDICYCPRCHQQMEKVIVEHGCGSIYAFYCHLDNLHWVLDCYGLVPPGTPRRWYGPFPCRTGWVVNWVYMQERAASFAKQGFLSKQGKCSSGEDHESGLKNVLIISTGGSKGLCKRRNRWLSPKHLKNALLNWAKSSINLN